MAHELLNDGTPDAIVVIQADTPLHGQAAFHQLLLWPEAHFDLRAYQGRTVQVQLVDHNTSGWGHIMADRFVAADAPAAAVAGHRAFDLGGGRAPG